ncbi:MAG TPA: M1 family aminopeptidase [Rudaea sp.]
MRAVFGCLVSFVLLARGAGAIAAEAVPTGKLPDDATPLAYTLKLKVDPREDRFEGSVRIKVRLARPTDHVWLHGQDLTVAKAVVVDAQGRVHPAVYTAEKEGVARVSFDRLPAQDVQLGFEYSTAFNAKLEGLYKVKVGGDSYAVTQMESISARNAFPGFDEPRFKTPFDITLTVPNDLVAIANTRPSHEGTSSDGKWKTIAYATTKPLPTYLVALAVGPWDVVDAPAMPANSIRDHPVPLRGIGPRGTGPQLKWILGETAGIVKYFEEYTGIAYPFDKLDLLGAPDFNAGAMENAGLIVFRDALLRIDDHTPSDTYRSSFDVTAHEVAHQWFGDLVTVPWWDDIWLNEAFATWAQGKETVALKPEYHGDLGRLKGTFGAMANDSLLSARKIRQPIAERGDIENAFDGITYQKGAAVLRMFEEWLGEDVFRAGMREYLKRHAFGSGNSDDLIAMHAEVSGKGETLKKAMRSFLDQPGIPLVHTALTCANGKASLELSQSRYLPYGVLAADNATWGVPVCVRFGRGKESGHECFLLEQARQTFAVNGGCAQWYLPNANAAGYYRFAMSDADLHALAQHVPMLAPVEQMSYADALASAFRRGEATPAAVLDALPALAKSGAPQVATALLPSVAWMHDHLANAATLPVLNAYVAHLFAPRLEQLGWRRKSGEEPATTQMRTDLANFLALRIRDRGVRKTLDTQGRAALGLDGSGKVDLTRADADLLRTALKVTVQEAGAPAFDAIVGELKINHQTRDRYAMLAALGATHDPKLGERARDLTLTPQIGTGELRYLISANVDEPENRDAFWTWLQTHYEAFRDRLPPLAQGRLPDLAEEGRCSDAQAAELETFFAPRIKQLIGGQRTLAQALEGTRQCAALREHVGEKGLASWAEAHPAQ